MAMTLALLVGLTGGCQRFAVVSADRSPTFLRSGQRLTLTNDAVLVPMALWIEINELCAAEVIK